MKREGPDSEQREGDVPCRGRSRIYPLPCLLTTAGLFSGFFSIIAAIDGDFFQSAVAILIAGVFDGLDGRVARLTGTCSEFGKEYDSLCDLVSFGLAPALLVYLWALEPFGRYGWLAAFLYTATTALRLARFNSMSGSGAADDFVGLPCPAAAGMVATTVLFCHFLGIATPERYVAILVLIYLLSYLMVSTIRYRSFKHPETSRAKTFQRLVGMVLVFIVLATEPSVTLFGLALAYVLSGPLAAAPRFLGLNRDKVEQGERSAP